jgi:hypothetical protein
MSQANRPPTEITAEDEYRLVDELTASADLKEHEWAVAHRWLALAKQVAKGTEALLYILLVVDCLILVAGIAKHAAYEPYGGGSLIVIVLAIALVRKLRGARNY